MLYQYYDIWFTRDIYTMKDSVKKIISTLIALGWLVTLGIYMYQWTTLIKDYVAQYNYYIIGALWAVFLIFLLQFWLVILPGKWLKVRAVVMGLIIVLLSYYFVNNDASSGVFAADILSVLWVLMIYLSLAGVTITKQAENKIAQSKQVIIEI